MKSDRPQSQSFAMAEVDQLREKSMELARKHPEKAAIILAAWMRQIAQVRNLSDEQARRTPKKVG